MRPVLVFDVGGSNLRHAVVTGRRVCGVVKAASPSFHSSPGKKGPALVSSLVEAVARACARSSRRHPELGSVVVGMPGMVDAEGVVLSAPPLWGTGARRVPLRRLLERRTGLAVTVANDLCGTALYYGRHPDFAAGCELLMVVALGTGVGCKTYDVRRGCLVTGAGGRGGEIGHISVEPAPAALPCDCGAAGHLSSYVSGRGIARLAAHLAEADPAGYRRSPLCGREQGPLIRVLPKAAARKDPFACRILDIAAEKLAAAFQAATGTLGVDRYVLVGGLAFALGDELGRRVTQRLREKGVFGWTQRELGKLVRVGLPNDDAALLGASWLAEPQKAREAA